MAFIPLLLGMLIGSSLLLFTGLPESWHYLRSVKAAWNLGHVVYFALFTLLLNLWPLIARQQLWFRWLLSLSIALVLGVVIELLQYGSNRTPDPMDLIRNLLGSLLVLVFYRPFLHDVSGVVLRLWQGMVSGLMLLLLMPLLGALTDEYRGYRQFPVLSDFSSRLELQRWKGEAGIMRVKSMEHDEGHLLKVNLSTAHYSGTGMQYLEGDWSQYQWLNFRFYQPQVEALRLTIRIHDDRHNNAYSDRFNQSYVLKQGWSTISIELDKVRHAPDSREMDMKHIRDVSFFSVKLMQPRTVYLDSLYLSDQ